MQRARTCYDHLAGQLGVALADSFERDQMLLPTASGWDLTSRGERKLAHGGWIPTPCTSYAAPSCDPAWTGPSAARIWPVSSARAWPATCLTWTGSVAARVAGTGHHRSRRAAAARPVRDPALGRGPTRAPAVRD